MIIPVVLCEGQESDLWPSARTSFPKQFIVCHGTKSLLQETICRLSGPEFREPILVTNDAYQFLVADQVKEIGLHDAEFIRRSGSGGPASAALIAALKMEETPEQLILVVPSDHWIGDAEAFLEAVRHGAQEAMRGNLVAFGSRSEKVDSDFGYLTASKDSGPRLTMAVTGYWDQLDEGRLAETLNDSKLFRDTGIYLFRGSDLIAAFDEHLPHILEYCRRLYSKQEQPSERLSLGDVNAEGELQKTSLSKDIFGKVGNSFVMPLEAGWSDIASWGMLHAVQPKDSHGVSTTGNVTSLGCVNTLLRCENGGARLVGVGLRNIAAIATKDAFLVIDLDHASEAKEVVEELRASSCSQADEYPRHYRPWGWYETLCLDNRFQVKRIMVKPGGVLSLQSHMHRAEHWVVVAGTARITVGEEVKLMSENESIYIPLGTVHRMENPGKLPMYLIEVQTGAYLGEDDIKRYEDIYDRC